MARQFDYSFKLLVVGDSGVGKTCLILRYVDQAFAASYISTIGIDSKVKSLDLDGLRLRLQIWDTAGQERFRTLTSAYYRGAMGVLLLYDITSSKSFDNVRDWLRNIDEHASPEVVKLLVGNKSDLVESREVPTSAGRDLAASHGVPFFETSAKTGQNIEECFLTISRHIYETKRKQEKRAVFGSPADRTHDRGTARRQPSVLRLGSEADDKEKPTGESCSC